MSGRGRAGACLSFALCFSYVHFTSAGQYGNLVSNPSFETGPRPWYDFSKQSPQLWGTFGVVKDSSAFEGTHSMRLSLDSDKHKENTGGTGIHGAVQDIAIGKKLPKTLSGRYRVDKWVPPTNPTKAVQYIEVLLISIGATNFPELGHASLQIGWILGGVSKPPIQIGNRHYVFVNKEEPKPGDWLAFDLDLHDAFTKTWGKVPEEPEHLRLFLETRFDRFHHDHDTQSEAEVYFDNIFLGGGDDGSDGQNGTSTTEQQALLEAKREVELDKQAQVVNKNKVEEEAKRAAENKVKDEETVEVEVKAAEKAEKAQDRAKSDNQTEADEKNAKEKKATNGEDEDDAKETKAAKGEDEDEDEDEDDVEEEIRKMEEAAKKTAESSNNEQGGGREL